MKLPRRLGSRRIQVARLGGAESALFGRGPTQDCPVAKDRRGGLRIPATPFAVVPALGRCVEHVIGSPVPDYYEVV